MAEILKEIINLKNSS